MGNRIGTDPATLNFLKVLIENKRMHLLAKMIDLFETFYRAEKGLVLCKVTSAVPLTTVEQTEVKEAMQKRAEQGSTLIMEYTTNPALLGFGCEDGRGSVGPIGLHAARAPANAAPCSGD